MQVMAFLTAWLPPALAAASSSQLALKAATNENRERNGYENPNGKEGERGHVCTASLRFRAA